MALHVFKAIRYDEKSAVEKIGAQFDTLIPADLVRVVADEAWVTFPIDEWIVGCRLVMQASQPVIGEVRIFPKDPQMWERYGITMSEDFDKVPLRWNGDLLGLRAQNVPAGGVTRTFLRDIPLGLAAKEIGIFVKAVRRDRNLKNLIQLFTQAMAPAFEPPRPRKGKPDLFYAELAQEYSELVNSGSRHPIVDLAKRHHKDVSQMRDMIREARERHLLETVKHGVPGGQLMPYAIELLQDQHMRKGPKQETQKKGGHGGRQRSRKTKS